MKTNRFITLTLILGVFSIASCDSALNTNPTASIDTEIALTNAENVASVLVGAYDAIGDGNLYGGWLLMIPDFLAESNEFTFTGTFFAPRAIYLKSQLYDNGQSSATWIQAYDAINIVNNVISALDLIEDADVRERIEGEAKFIRGAVYFELVRLFAPTFESGNANNQAGVPLVLTPTASIGEANNVERASVSAVYTQILADLGDAKTLLDDTNPVESYYVNSMVASAFLSRVHLQMGNYADARDEAHRVIQSNNYILTPTYEEAFNNGTNSTEDIFAMQVSGQDGVNSLFTFYSADSRGDVDIKPSHLDEYEAGDDRLNLFYNDPFEPSIIRSGKWNESTNGNVSIVRLAEMYLTRAEAIARVGPGTTGATAEGDLFKVRDRVNLPLIVAPTVAQILQERKVELIFEGNLLHDIKRTQGTVGARAYDDDKLVLPIPRRELDTNPNLCQNASYQGTSCQ